MRMFTPGGVIAPGGAVLDGVPKQHSLVFEVKVRPLDIDVVRPDLHAMVRFVACEQRTTPSAMGSVTFRF